jgi:hypothetical protein
MPKTVYLDYTIWIADPVQLAALVGPTGSDASVYKAPTVAAVDYNAPLMIGDVPFFAPSISSPVFGWIDKNYPRNEATFDRCDGGWFGVCWLFGTPYHYVWRGVFKYGATIPAPVPGDPVRVPMAKRRWIDGFELPLTGEGQVNANPQHARAASRHLNGYGALFDSSANTLKHVATESGDAATNELWERFYVRVRRFSNTQAVIWKANISTGGGRGPTLAINPTGEVVAFAHADAFPPDEIMGTTAPLVVNRWYRFDVLYRINPISAGPSTINFFNLFIDGVKVVNAGVVSNQGMNQTATIVSSEIGFNTANTLIMHVDDWIGSELPNIGSPATALPAYWPEDFIRGSRVVKLSARPPVLRLEGTLTVGSALVTDLPDTTALRAGMKVYGVSTAATDATATPAESAAYVAAVKADCVAQGLSLVGADGAFEITSRVAWGLRETGCGLLSKTSGNNSHGYASDIVIFADGRAFDILTDGGGANGPLWSASVVTDGLTRYRPAITPAGGGAAGVAPTIVSIDSLTQVTLDTPSTKAETKLLAFVGASAFAADHDGAWVGDWRQLQPYHVRSAGLIAPLTCSTGGAKLSVTTDAGLEVDQLPATLGITALRVALFSDRVGVANGTLGYKLPGGADVMAAITQATVAAWAGVMYRPSALLKPITPLAGLEVKFTKDANASLCNVQALHAVAEVIGVFGAEDLAADAVTSDPTAAAPARAPGIHNAPYPWSPWARTGTRPINPVVIHSGTYVGNGTFTDLVFRAPVHWLWIREVGFAGHCQWIASANGGRVAGDQQYSLEGPVVVRQNAAFIGGPTEDDQEQQTILSLVGNTANANANGVTYHYIAIEDPGMRFFAAGALAAHVGATAMVTPLDSPTFTPDAVFLHYEHNANAGNGLFYKGPGHAATAVSPLNGVAEVAIGLSMGLGQLTYQSGLAASSVPQIPYFAVRKDDHSGDPGIPRVVQIGSYTGDGSATRTIGLTPSGRRPLWALVVPHNATASFVRDAVHSGTTSQTVNGSSTNAATGIIAGGIDLFTVGILLNAAGIIYDYFLLMGGVDACNNGWSCDGEFVPVEPGPPPPEDPGPWDPEPIGPIDPVDPDPTGPGIPGPGPDLGPECAPWSTIVINQALSKIGVTKPVVNIATEVSKEADVARLHYADTVTTVLRDFPWPFATKYRTLAALITPPGTLDWAKQYRRPTDCVFERRLVVPRTGAVDPTPPPFQLSSDSQGGLILTNQADAVLEYTYRPSCSAFVGDPLWREAMVWKLAGAMAPGLSRMTNIVEHCEKQYNEALLKATLIIRPGNPGELPVAGQFDLDAVSQAANTAVVNRGLVRIGARPLANLHAEQSQAAQAARAVFEAELRSCLRDHAWAFATVYVTPVRVAGTLAVPVNNDWQYSYRLSDDVVFVRRIITDAGKRTFQVDPPPFRLARDTTGPLLLTDHTAPHLEVTQRTNGCVAGADDLFREAFAWRLAASLAPSLAGIDPARIEQEGRGPDYTPKDPPRITQQQRALTTRWAWQMYGETLRRAQLADAREQQQVLDDHLPDWITGRD